MEGSSIVDIQQSVERSLPFGKRKVEAAGRKFYSQYFEVQGDEFLRLQEEKPSVRYFAEVIIVGFHRPYTVEVVVYKQKLVTDSFGKGSLVPVYITVEVDPKRSQVVLERIQKQLSLRRKNRSFIDDFRAF